MRQAGRYLPEYQEVKSRHTFVEMCSQPELAVEISLQPLRRYDFDAVIVFYDILYLLEAMGAPLEFLPKGPVIHSPVSTVEEVRQLHDPDLFEEAPGKGTGAVLASLRELRRVVPEEKAVLGFAGAPFTLAAYLIEGSFGRSGERIRRLLHQDPKAVHLLLERLSGVTAEYLSAQLDAGASAVQLFDTWAGLLSPEDFREFALPYQKAVFARLAERQALSVLYINGSYHLLDELKDAGARALSLDWRQSVAAARARFGPGVALQGNLDPAALFAPPVEVARRVGALLDSMRGDPGFIFNLGHGIHRETPVESVAALVETVKAFQP